MLIGKKLSISIKGVGSSKRLDNSIIIGINLAEHSISEAYLCVEGKNILSICTPFDEIFKGKCKIMLFDECTATLLHTEKVILKELSANSLIVLGKVEKVEEGYLRYTEQTHDKDIDKYDCFISILS